MCFEAGCWNRLPVSSYSIFPSSNINKAKGGFKNSALWTAWGSGLPKNQSSQCWQVHHLTNMMPPHRHLLSGDVITTGKDIMHTASFSRTILQRFIFTIGRPLALNSEAGTLTFSLSLFSNFFCSILRVLAGDPGERGASDWPSGSELECGGDSAWALGYKSGNTWTSLHCCLGPVLSAVG